MGDVKLCLVMLLSTYALAQQEARDAEEPSPTCFLAKRYKNFRRYVYQYEAETENGVNGASALRNGPKVACKVEIDVPQTCSFVLRTSECLLTEVVDVDADGTPVFEPVATSKAFQVAMEKNALKVIVEGETGVKLFPEEDEPVNILNIKRGIVSALLVPLMEEDKNKKMATIHGICETDFQVNVRQDIATDVTITRDLSSCDSFIPQRDHTSPLAIISGMQIPLSKLIGSTQTCSYQFDNHKKHMTSGTCTEKHIFLPFSHQDEYGVSATVTQTFTLKEIRKINDRVFDYNEATLKSLPMEAAVDKTPDQTTDAVLATLRELKDLPQTQQGHQRASIFQRLVTEVRGLKLESLRQAAPVMEEVDNHLTLQALVQCGTPECTSAMLQMLSIWDSRAVEVDAIVFALGMLPNPSRLLVQDMLEMAKVRQTRAVMYPLSNVVRKLYQAEGKVTPEITAVYEFVTSILSTDCSGEKDLTFLALRVIGNMGEAMEAADPKIKSILMKCMRQPSTTLSVQTAAIQAFRRMSVTDEVRSNIQRVAQYAKGAVQKRLAAYLILMRKPEASDLELVKKILTSGQQNMQVKTFVESHIYNIINSKDPETHELGQRIIEVLQVNEVTSNFDLTEFSRNYKMEAMQTSVQGNIIFDPSSHLPREVMLETTLKAFGYNLDMWEIGMEGKGLEPTVESLFGKNGFFPDTVSKVMYWAGNKLPIKVNEALQDWLEPLRTTKMKRQVPESIVREIVRNFNKLAKDLRSQESPEAMAYLRIMGVELGYMKNTELMDLAQKVAMYAEIFFKKIPSEIMSSLVRGEQSLFAHYIFMDNEFSLPTAAGFPLKFALSGTFAPGVKGSLRNMRDVSFAPSMGVEFVTKMGIHIPEFVVSAVEMHTNMYHESALHAKITMAEGQIKLTIPAPRGTTQLLGVSNRVLMVTSGQATLVPPMTEGRTNSVKCSPLFNGMKYCTTVRYTLAGPDAFAPFFPLTGETKFAVDIQPTGEITDYTATFSYKFLSEGKDGRQKVDSLKMILRAEGDKPSEAATTVRYNRNKNTLTTSIQIPDYDVEAGIRVGITDSSVKGKKITIEISNQNIPQLTLIGRARLEEMRDGMLQVQLIVPALKTEAAVTATMQLAGELTLELESSIKLPETSSVQKVTFKYGEDNVQVELKSVMDSEIQKLLPNTEAVQDWLRQLREDILDQQVAYTDMKMRHIYTKSAEASQIWLDKISAGVPYAYILKENTPKLVVPTMPEKLYLNSESTFRYQFNKDHLTITIPLPMGGKSSKDLGIPRSLATPDLAMHQIGLMLPRRQINLPTFSIPSNYDLTLPLLGMVEVSAKVNSNFYNWEATVSGGNNTVEGLSYIAKYKVVADCPIEFLSYTVEGTAQISDIPEEGLKTIVNSNLNHKLMDARFNFVESVSITDSIKATGNYKVEAFSPLGMQMSLDLTSQASITTDIIGDANMDGSVTVGSMSASTSFSQSFALHPSSKEARAQSSFKVTTPLIQIHNKIKAAANNGELSFESNTNINNDPIKHTTKFNIEYKESQFTFKSDSVTKADKKMLHNQLDFSATVDKASIRVESQADDTTNRAYALLSGSLNPQGLELNADASINFDANRGSHKGTLSLKSHGLSTSCTTTAQISPLTFENDFQGDIGAAGANIIVTTKGTIQENIAELKIEGRVGAREAYLLSTYKGDLFNANTRNRVSFRVNEDGLNFSNNMVASLQDMKTENTNSLKLNFGSLVLRSESDNFISESNSYKHNIAVDMESFTASVNVNNDLTILGYKYINDAQFKVEPYKMELTGTLKGAYAEEELRHTYEINYADMAATAKCSTTGKLLGTQMTQSSDLEVVGLSLKFSNEARFNSPSLRLDSKILTKAEPFTFSVDASLNTDGDLNLYGTHSGQLKGKFLMNAKPLKFSHQHECKASTTHQLENGGFIETNFQNEISSALIPQEQMVNLKMESKINNHAFSQMFQVFNTPENMGIELTGTVLTNLLNKVSDDNQEFAISGAVKYDKNSESHSILMPFIENLPAAIEQLEMTMTNLKGRSIDLLQDADAKYEIRASLHKKAHELKRVIKSFDIHLFVQDAKNFINSVDVEKCVGQLVANIPTEEITRILRSIRDMIFDWVKRNDIGNKISDIYSRVEEILAQYEIEKIVEAIMDSSVELMKKCRVKEVMRLISVYIKPLFDKFMGHINELVQQLNAFDFRQMIDNLSDYVHRMLQKGRYFDYSAFADEAKQKVIKLSMVPCFGKLSSSFEVKSPDHSFKTTAELQNSTDSSETPQFTTNVNSQFKSSFDLLAYTLDATAQFAVPKRSHLSLTETVKVNHMSFSFDHQGSATIYGTSAQASAKTTAKAITDPYTAELVNNAFFALESGFSGTLTRLDTSYNHNVNMPLANIFSDVRMTQKTVAQLEAGTITLTLGNEGRGKWAINDYSNEGTHKSDLKIVMNVVTTKLTFAGMTESSLLKMKQSVNVETGVFSHITIDARAETETPFMKSSVAVVKGHLKVQDLEIELTASHDAELIGKVEGILSNSLNFKAKPFMIVIDCKNKDNTKLALPFKLSAKVDLQNDFAITFNPTVQQASWMGLARFNQYKYSHSFTMSNGEKEMHIFASVNGEANLDVLTVPITIPELTLPFIGVTTPAVESVSLWESTGLNKVLITTQQTFDMDAKLRYRKSPETFAVDINMEPIFNAINKNVKILNKNLILGRDKAVDFLTASYDLAAANIEVPKTLTVPGYKVPVVNVEVSSFTIPLPDFSVITMPALRVPTALSKLTLPKISLPKMQKKLLIPVMGDLTYEFSVKSAMITLNANAGIFNHEDIVAKFEARSSSEFAILKAKVVGTSTLNRNTGVKLTSTLSLEHMNVEGSHDSTIILKGKVTEASIANVAKVNLPILKVELYQELTGNAEEGLTISFSSPSAGLLGLQLQSKNPARLNGKLYSRYPSEPQNDVDILKVKIAVIDSNKLKIQTSWNMEAPNAMLLALKDRVPDITSTLNLNDMMTNHIDSAYNEITKVYSTLESSMDHIKDQGKVIYRRAVENIAAADLDGLTNNISNTVMYILSQYQRNIQALLDAAIKFLRETKFRLPGHPEKISGLEVYQKFSTFIADVVEDVVRKVPEAMAYCIEPLINCVRNVEFTIPGSSYLISGDDILDDLHSAFEKIQNRVVTIARSLGDITLESIAQRLSDFLQFSVEKTQELLNTLTSQYLYQLSAWVSDVYTDAINSQILRDITKQVEEAMRIAQEYYNTVKIKLSELFAELNLEQLNTDIQAWIDSVVKCLDTFQNQVIELLKEVSNKAEFYVAVSDRKMDIEIPLPFLAQ